MVERELFISPPLVIPVTVLRCSRAPIFCAEGNDGAMKEHFLSSHLCRKAEVKPIRRISINSQQDPLRNTVPLVTSISRSLPILMLLLGSHSVPFLRLRAVSPSVVEECARVLYQLHVIVSIWSIPSEWGSLGYTYTHPSADDE